MKKTTSLGIQIGGPTREEVEEILSEYVCDSGHERLKKYVPTLVRKSVMWDWDSMVRCAFDYYRTFYNIKTLEKVYHTSMGSQMVETREIINIY